MTRANTSAIPPPGSESRAGSRSDPEPELSVALAGARDHSVSQATLDAILGGLESQIAVDRGALAWLRSRPTPWRIAVAAIPLLAIGVMTTGHPLAYPPLLHVGISLALIAAAGLTLPPSLRPAHRPPPGRWRVALLAGATVAVPVAVALVPSSAAAPSHAASHGGAWACFVWGCAIALGVATSWWAVDRTPGSSARRALLAAGAAGVVGNLFLHGRCGAVDAGHLLLGHASVSIAWVLGCVLWAGLARTR